MHTGGRAAGFARVRYSLDSIRDAVAYQETGQTRGKVSVSVAAA
jgi:hypothetical protein